MPTFTIGAQISTALAHPYADGDVGNLEYRIVDLGSGDPVIDWADTQIVQTSTTGEGPPWIYTATRDSALILAYWVALNSGEEDPDAAGLAATLEATYQAQWRSPSDGGGPWIDDDAFTLVATSVTVGLEEFRLLLDDVDGLLFTDVQVAYFIASYPSDVRLAVAAAADTLALRFASGVKKFTTDGQSFERGSRSAGYAALAKQLRTEVADADGGMVTEYMTRIDGNSDDISAQDTGAGILDGTGRVGWRFVNVHGDEDSWLPS